MAIKINTAYGERLTSGMLNEKIANIVGGNEKLNGFDVAIASTTSVTITPGKAIVAGCAIEETSETRTITISEEILSTDKVAYIVLAYVHETGAVTFECVDSVATNMVKLATLFTKDGVISELTNHTTTKTLNTVVAEAAEIEAQKVRDSIHSGFVELGELDYDFMLNNENQVKLKTKSVAYINGYRVEIPAGTIINIGKAPEKESREDLVFLEAWKDSDFNKDGKLKWRIRHVADVDFKTFPEGIGIDETTWNRIAWLNYPSAIAPQGGNTEVPELLPRYRYKYMFGKMMGKVNKLDISEFRNFPNVDLGLYTSGNGDSTSKEYLKTIDGYCYAIPMFRLYRKPSCGKAIPFEYDKINPKVDYSKFAKLVQDEKVERVHSENIKGNSVVNFAKSLESSWRNNSTTLALRNYAFRDLVVGSKYSFILLGLNNKNNWCVISSSTFGGENNQTVAGYSTDLIKVVTITSEMQLSTNKFLITHIQKNASTVIPNDVRLIILEGDWTDKDIPEYFEGLKSLGEDDGNLVTVKNGVLNDNTYDPCDGNQKLNTFPNITHVISENTIIPEFTAELKKGGVKQSDVTAFGKLTTEGNEQVEFTKIKGKTLQNLFGADSPNIQSEFSRLQCSNVKNKNLYTSGTYTIVNLSDKVIQPNKYNTSGWISSIKCPAKSKTVVSLAEGESIQEVVAFYSEGWTASDLNTLLKSLIILKGDYSNVDMSLIPFILGISSVGENESNALILLTHGKNLINKSTAILQQYWSDSNTYIYEQTSFLFPKYIKVLEGESYRALLPTQSTSCQVMEYDTNYKFIRRVNIDINNSYVVPNGVSYLRVSFYKVGLDFMPMFCRSTEQPSYEPYKEYKQEVYLKEPLRSLPNGVCDEIVGNKVIRRVGKVVLNGSETWYTWGASNSPTHCNTHLYVNGTGGGLNLDIDPNSTGKGVCDTLCVVANTYQQSIKAIGITPSYFALGLPLTELGLTTQNGDVEYVSATKTWLSQNPTTVYYQLANPVEEYLEHVYEKESIKTYQLDAPLRSLPNGVKDEIKDGVLIRRCAEIVYNGSESWSLAQDHKENYAIFNREFPTNFYATTDKTVLPDKIINKYVWDTQYTEEGLWFDSNGNVYISIAKSKLDTINGDGFKKYLQSNPIKVIYQCFHYETVLTEAKPQNANFSLQRQFGEGNWLRELPNGVKDTVENGKVIRRVGKVVLNGSEGWKIYNDNSTHASFNLVITDKKNGVYNIFANYNTLKSNSWYADNVEECYGGDGTTARLFVRIAKSRLTSNNTTGFKTWLSQNPITVLYELNATTEEALSTDNYMPFPCHDFNTYCGSMYVGQGRNHVVNENKMPSEDVVIIDTPFRSIEGKAKVEDCRYKKCEDGYDTAYEGSNTINLVDLRSVPSNRIEGEYIKFSTKGNTTGTMFVGVYPIDGTIDYLSHPTKYTDVFTTREARKYRLLLGINGNVVDDKIWVELNLEPYTTYYKKVTFEKISENQCRVKDIIISKGDSRPNYVPYVPTTKYFENVEENDIQDLRHLVSLTGFNYDKILNESFDSLLRGKL